MQSRSPLHVLFALSTLILSKVPDVTGSGHSCLRSSRATDGQTRVTFLREDAVGARSLYLSLWSEDIRLVTCEVNTDPVVTERYRSICDTSGAQGQDTDQRFNISMLVAPDAPCTPRSPGAPKLTGRARRNGTEGRSRIKRSWIFPGTLWCGTGSTAAKYEQLGMFESADRCCREHDHCLHIIPALTVKYGVFNRNLYTVSHCDCDQRFQQCLLGVNDTISSMVGYSFFKILRVPCFELQHQKRCTQMYMWGKCKVEQKGPYAVFKPPLTYTSDVKSKYRDNTGSNKSTVIKGQNVTESPVINRTLPKDEHSSSSRGPPRGDTFYSKGTKGKGWKRHRGLHTVAPSHITPLSRAPTPSMKMGLLNSITLIPNKKRSGKKKSTRKGLSANPTRSSQVPSQVTTNSHPKTTFTTQSTPFLTQKSALLLNLLTAITAVPQTTKNPKKGLKQSRCCVFKVPLKGGAFPPHCRSGLGKTSISHTTTVTPPTTTYMVPLNLTTLVELHLKRKKETPKQDTLKTLWTTSAMPLTTKLKTLSSLPKYSKPQKQMDPHLLNKKSQEPMDTTQAQNTHAERGMADNQPLCWSLKQLDECKYKIPPLEKKYDLQNTESKTAYHCDCTSSLAAQIKSSKQPRTLPTLLMDFVSQYCFKLPKEKKCPSRKSCSVGFTKASDLLRALKKIEEKDAAGEQHSRSERKRGIPVSFYKRCLRLEREAQLTWL